MDEISSNLAGLCYLYEDETFYPKYQKYLNKLFHPHFEKLGWNKKEGEKESTSSFRATVISMLIKSGDEEITKEAINLCEKYITDPVNNNIPVSLRGVVFSAFVDVTDEKQATRNYDIMHDYLIKTDVQDEKLRIIHALTTAKHLPLINRTLNMAFTGEVRTQDLYYVFLCSRTSQGLRPTWEFFKERYDEIRNKVKSGTMLWPDVVSICTSVYIYFSLVF